jgi:hypothetical protein
MEIEEYRKIMAEQYIKSLEEKDGKRENGHPFPLSPSDIKLLHDRLADLKVPPAVINLNEKYTKV